MRKTPEATQATVDTCRRALELTQRITERLQATIDGDAAATDMLHWGHHGTAVHAQDQLAQVAAHLGIIDIDELESTGSIVYLPR